MVIVTQIQFLSYTVSFNMPMTGKELLKLLQKNGWQIIRIKGSHHIMAKEGIPYTIPIPVHSNTTLKPGIEHSILKLAGLK